MNDGVIHSVNFGIVYARRGKAKVALWESPSGCKKFSEEEQMSKCKVCEKEARTPYKSKWFLICKKCLEGVERMQTELVQKNIFELSAEVVSLKILLDHATEKLEALENYHTLILDYKELLERVLELKGELKGESYEQFSEEDNL